MKLRNATVRLGYDGRPEFCFVIEPENDLERDALKAAEFHQESHRNDPVKDIMVVQIQNDTQTDGEMRTSVWCSSQISQEAYHRRKSGKS